MRKVGVFMLVLLLLLSFSVLVNALSHEVENDTVNDEIIDDATDNDLESTTDVTTSLASTSTLGNWSKSFECLETKAGNSCEDIDTITEIALTILATPDNIIDGCVEKLKSLERDNHFLTIKDTALGLLALQHVGEDTALIEKWLLEQRQNPTDIIWFLQEDSEGFTNCIIDDGTLRYDIEIDENKKINVDAGECLTRAQSNFWYKINPDCYSRIFKISCDQDFLTNLLYKNQRSSTIYVLEDTEKSPQHGKTEHSVSSKCLGTPNGCDYEGTAWASIALQDAGYNIDEYIPYLISTSDVKKSYLPEAFIYKITGYKNYGTKLIQDQKSGSYWEAEFTEYNRFYDTALALLALGTTQEQTQKATQWLLFEQGSNGCWANSVRETAFILWAVHQRGFIIESSSEELCSDSGFFCVDQSACSDDSVLGNYYCSGISKTCCSEKRLLTCSEEGGEFCQTGQICQGIEVEVSDLYACCTGVCADPEPQISECEEFNYGCYSSCGDGKEEVSFDCDSGSICCKNIFIEESKGIPWWIWLLIALIVLIFLGILWFYRDKISSRFKKDEDEERPLGLGGFHGRPGMPPRRPEMPMRGGMRHGGRGMPMRRRMPIRRGVRRPPLKPGQRLDP